MSRKAKLTINLPPELIGRSKIQADEIGTSLSVVIERLLSKWLETGGQIPGRPIGQVGSKPKRAAN
jgi:Family of unknown function (DUF6364)